MTPTLNELRYPLDHTSFLIFIPDITQLMLLAVRTSFS